MHFFHSPQAEKLLFVMPLLKTDTCLFV